jgi:hypothetical protein
MSNDDEPGFDPLGRSASCVGGTHQDCAHIGASFRSIQPDRLHSTILLCRCPCHAACPVTGWRHVPLTAWQELCECPGEKPQRAWKEDAADPWPGAREQWERDNAAWAGRRQARKQAFEAAREAATGKTRQQVREIYLEELRARGQEMPSQPLLEAQVDMLTGRPIRALTKIWQAFTRPDYSEH